VARFVMERSQTRPGDTFTFAGTGTSDLPELHGCPGDRVRIVPSFARPELPALLASHDVGLFTSRVEGWGLSLSEMLESGMVVFATRAGGVPDLAPFFPASLRTFPPPPRVESLELEDLASNGYYRQFDWNTIAAAYEQAVLPLCQPSLPS
jgi:glycosyltransferase involved in cell wall biosynthesis